MAAEIISTVTTGKDRNLEINKNKKDEDFPLKIIDQNKTVSTRNVVPNKREIKRKDVDKLVDKLKKDQKEKLSAKKKEKAPGKKTEKKVDSTEEKKTENKRKTAGEE